MNVICLVYDSSQKRDCLRALYVVNSLYYDTDINGMVMSCADGSMLVKRMSIKYYEGSFNRVLEGAFGVDSKALDTSSFGAFMRVPAGEDIMQECLWGPRAHIFHSSKPSWDPGDDEPETPSRKGGMSQMRLE